VTADVSARGTRDVPALGYGDYVRFSSLLQERCGLNFPDKRRPELDLAVRHAFATSTCADLEEFFCLLQDPANGAVEVDRLINAATISETHFFRDMAQFDALFQHVLPQLIENRRSVRTLRIWSAGCASGEEPYSIAMLLRELLPDVDEWAITILGTDINTESLQRARKAIFGEWAFREERAKQWRPRYFRPVGNRYELIPQVQRMVSFAKLNLAEPRYPSYDTNTTLVDLLLCRNVTIYFEESVTPQVIDRFYDCLIDGGWLVVGHSEPSLFTYRRFQARNFPDTIMYQRTGQPTVLPMDWGLSPAGGAAAVAAPAFVHSVTCVPPAPPAPVSQAEEPDSFERAKELLEYGHSEEARDVLLRLVKTRPSYASARALLGQAYANLGQWQEAERWCGQAVRLDNLLLDAYYTLALVMQHQGKLDQAIVAMKKVIYLDRNYVLGHFGLADLYRNNSQMPQAFKSLDNAHRLLERCADDQIIAGSGGITVGRLRETVIRQQQQWGADQVTH